MTEWSIDLEPRDHNRGFCACSEEVWWSESASWGSEGSDVITGSIDQRLSDKCHHGFVSSTNIAISLSISVD